MARASSGLAYPERFYAAASYAGFGGGSPNPSSEGAISKFQNDVALLLYGLHQQATVGPCNVPKPRAWNPVENSKWTSWNGLGNMASTEAMRLFVKILEEEDPSWYSRVPEFVVEPVVDIEMNTQKLESVTPNGNLYPEPKTISTENGSVETEDKDVVLEGLGSVGIYDQWVAPSVSGQRPKARYEHGAALIQEKMYIFGGNHNGHYLNDLQELQSVRGQHAAEQSWCFKLEVDVAELRQKLQTMDTLQKELELLQSRQPYCKSRSHLEVCGDGLRDLLLTGHQTPDTSA